MTLRFVYILLISFSSFGSYSHAGTSKLCAQIIAMADSIAIRSSNLPVVGPVFDRYLLWSIGVDSGVSRPLGLGFEIDSAAHIRGLDYLVEQQYLLRGEVPCKSSTLKKCLIQRPFHFYLGIQMGVLVIFT